MKLVEVKGLIHSSKPLNGTYPLYVNPEWVQSVWESETAGVCGILLRGHTYWVLADREALVALLQGGTNGSDGRGVSLYSFGDTGPICC